jgi:hypothetical protein
MNSRSKAMKSWNAALVIAAQLIVSSVHAEPSVPPPVLEYGFDDELVPGDLVRPNGEVVQVRRRNVRVSLVEVRSSYLPELLKSVEDL